MNDQRAFGSMKENNNNNEYEHEHEITRKLWSMEYGHSNHFIILYAMVFDR